MEHENDRLGATIGLLRGGTRECRLSTFDPAAGELVLEPPREDGASDRTAAVIPIAEISYVAFDSRPESMPDASLDTTKRCRIHVVGGRSFLVNVVAADLEDPRGCFAVPASAKESPPCFYFYGHGISVREEDCPIGALLVRDGALAEEDLQRGIEIQKGMRPSLGEILVADGQLQRDDLVRATQLQATRRVRIGEILVDAGLVSQETVERALAEQRKHGGKRLGEILVEMGALDEERLARALAEKFFLPFVDLAEYPIQPHAIDEVGVALIEKHGLLPIASDRTGLTVAISDPLAVDAIDTLRFRLGKSVKEVVVMLSQLREYIEVSLRGKDRGDSGQFGSILREFDDSELTPVDQSYEDEREASALDSAVVKLVNQIMADALRRGASDVHIEPNGRQRPTTVRFRVNGDCEAYQEVPPGLRRALVARLKILAGLDIAERRKPQDGKTAFRIARDTIEVRVATLPTGEGDEDAVLRILSQSRALTLGELNLGASNRAALATALQRPYGLILCVGPTGSGKTTTLHSLLAQLNSVDRKIWTAEDPIEISQPGLRQLQVHPKIGLTFAAALRSFLRADPDVIMVGEMRDHETATIAVEASLTGHLVLSTLHTNGAPETVTRLLEMGLEPFSFADALVAVLAQRLVRSLCRDCRREREPKPQELDHVRSLVGPERTEQLFGETGKRRFFSPVGCGRCKATGYAGRVALHELLVTTPALVTAIQRRSPAVEVREIARASGMSSLLEDGLSKVVTGTTDLEQVLAACGS
jgi:type II secretory ATPase GspE/PulE/Tfp pilus assembly ATPase PilB-like protein